jgi:hypothetical protein
VALALLKLEMSNTKCRLMQMKLYSGFDSDASVCWEAKGYIELFKKMYTKSIEALTSISSDLKIVALVQNTHIQCF